jgi:hypothetical protein
MRDSSLPIVLRLLERREAMLKYMALGEEQTRQAEDELNSVQNSLKVYRGQLAGLKDNALMESKMKDEVALRRSPSRPARNARSNTAAPGCNRQSASGIAPYVRERRILDQAAGFNSTLFGYARTLVRLAAESTKPNAQRLPEFTEARRASVEQALYSTAPIHEDFEKLKLADSLGFMVELLGADNPLVKQILNVLSPEARAAELLKVQSKGQYRREMVKGGEKAIEVSTDPMIVLRLGDTKARGAGRAGMKLSVGASCPDSAGRFETEGQLYPDATY